MCFQLISDLFLPAIPANRDYSLKRNVSLSLLSYRHPERSRGIFVAAALLFPLLIRLHEAPYPTFMEYQASRSHIHGVSGFPFPFTRIHRLTANGKDFSLALEMTCGRRSPLIVFHTVVDSSQPRLQDKAKRTNHLHD